MFQVASTGGKPQSVTTPRADFTHRFPSFLPDGGRFLYIERGEPLPRPMIYAGDLDRVYPPRPILQADSQALFFSGRLIFVRENSLMSQPFDPVKLRLSGEPSILASHVPVGPERSVGDFSVSESGVLVSRSERRTQADLAWVDRRGFEAEVLPAAGGDRDVALSPDGKLLATVELGSASDDGDVWLRSMQLGTRRRLTESAGIEFTPVWSADSKTVYFSRHLGGSKFWILQKSVADTSEPVARMTSDRFVAVTDAAWDGSFLLYQVRTVRGDFDLWLLPSTPDAKPQPVLQSRFEEVQARVSPDGRWIAYSSDESGRFEIYLRSLAPPFRSVQVSRNGGIQPRWRHDGREIFFLSPTGWLMAVAVQALDAGAPVELFQSSIDAINYDAKVFPQYSVSFDGELFLMSVARGLHNPSPWTLLVKPAN